MVTYVYSKLNAVNSWIHEYIRIIWMFELFIIKYIMSFLENKCFDSDTFI